MTKLTVAAPVFNEVENIEEFVRRTSEICRSLEGWNWEIFLIDNASQDGTREILIRMEQELPQLKVVYGAYNTGHLINQFEALIRADGDVVILLASDLQDPPELIPTLLHEWELGAPLVLLQKIQSEESQLIYGVRKFFYRLMERISDSNHYYQVNGAGLYDRILVEQLRERPEMTPYLRGWVGQLGVLPVLVEFVQPLRQRGTSKNNWSTLFDLALLGLVSSSKFPIRFTMLLGSFFFLMGWPVVYWDLETGFFLVMLGLGMTLMSLMAEYCVRTVELLPRGTRMRAVNSSPLAHREPLTLFRDKKVQELDFQGEPVSETHRDI